MSRRRPVPRNSSIASKSLQASNMEANEEQPNKRNSLKEKLIAYCNPMCVKVCSSEDQVDNGNPEERAKTCNWKRFLKPVLVISVLVITAVLIVVFVHPKLDTVCYIRVGCFSLSGPWSERPTLWNFVPQSPSVINTTFIVTSRNDPDGAHGAVHPTMFSHFGVVNEAHIPWNSTSLIVFLIHGWTDRSGTWMQTLKQAFLNQTDNIIVVLVDWKAGAASKHYPQVVANTRIVAKEITLFIQYIQRRFGRESPKQIHLVGHSLGSQISSYVGKSFVNSSYEIHQITALDPAYPLFEGYNPEIRLDKSDARHVLVVHSNIGPWGAGMKAPVGTVDIYLNNGRDQRGCDRMISTFRDADMKHEDIPMKVDNQSLPKIVGAISGPYTNLVCSHRRAYVWLEDILRDMAGILYVNHTHTSNPVIAYPIQWTNGTDILALTSTRAIWYSFCREHNDQQCWKLEQSKQNAFFHLPSPDIETGSSTFFVPTMDQSPFCARFALLEITTCPYTSDNVHLEEWHSSTMTKMLSENITMTLSQAVFDEELLIYQGLLYHRPKIHAWVEFSCDSLQLPPHLQGNAENINEEKYLSVKLAVSLTSNEPTKSGTGKSSTKTLSSEDRSPELCVNKMKLVYFNETAQERLSLKWSNGQLNKGQNSSNKMLIAHDNCVEIKFPL